MSKHEHKWQFVDMYNDAPYSQVTASADTKFFARFICECGEMKTVEVKS